MQMFLLVILPFAALALAATLISLELHQNAMRAMVAERDTHAAATAANFLESKIQAEQETLSALAMYLTPAGDLYPQRLSAFEQAHGYFGKNLAYVSNTGEVLAFSGLPEVRRALQGMVLKTGETFVSEINGTSYLWLVATVETGGLAVNIIPIQPLLQEVLGQHQHGTAFLLDRNSRVLAQLGQMDWDGKLSAHPGVVEALRGESGFTYVSTGNAEHVVAYSVVSLSNRKWALVTREPWEMVDTPYLRLTQFAPLILLPLLAFTLVALWFSLSQIIGPLRRLEKSAAELAWGNFESIEKSVGGVREIRQLQNELAHMAHKVQDAQQSLHDYIGAMTRGQEDERRRLARELHDETLQSLIALRQRVQLAQMKAKDDEMQASLAELDGLSNSAIDELRRLSRALRPIYLEDLGLVTALEMLTRESAGLDVKFVCVGSERRLDPGVELSLFRIAQEALSNVNRHAQATQAQVRIDFQPGTVTLEVSDNGCGFTPPRSPAEFAPGGHFGLLGMHERVELIGGKLTIESAPEKGSSLRVDLHI